MKCLTTPDGIQGMINFVDLESPWTKFLRDLAALIDAESVGTKSVGYRISGTAQNELASA